MTGDYTLDRKELYEDLTVDEVLDNAAECAKKHPLPEETRQRVEDYKKAHPYSN